MISDLISLVELTRQLASRKNELDKNFFKDFIEPIWDAFSKVHQDYKDSFVRYKKLVLEEQSEPMDISEKLLETIKDDSVYSKDFRSELDSLMKNLPTTTLRGNKVLVSDFLEAIDRYFTRDYKGHSQLINLRAYMQRTIKLRRDTLISQSNYRKGLLVVIEPFLAYIQNHYEEVSSAYYRLKKEFLA